MHLKTGGCLLEVTAITSIIVSSEMELDTLPVPSELQKPFGLKYLSKFRVHKHVKYIIISHEISPKVHYIFHYRSCTVIDGTYQNAPGVPSRQICLIGHSIFFGLGKRAIGCLLWSANCWKCYTYFSLVSEHVSARGKWDVYNQTNIRKYLIR